MKILIPVGDFCRTGGYRVLSELANEWIRSNHDVTFLAPNFGQLPYFPTTAAIILFDKKGNIVESRDANFRGSIFQYISMYKAINAISENYDIILANYSLTAFPVYLSRCSNSKKYYYIQAYEPEYFWYKKNIKAMVIGTLSKLSYYLPLTRIVNAPIYFRYKNIHSDMFVLPGMDLKIFKPKQKTEIDFTNKKTIIVGCIGRKEPEKGTKYVLDAFEQLYSQDKRFLLRVAYGNLPGDWSHERCEIITPNNDSELADFYRSLDILIAPGTLQHGAPHYPVLEAMACGVPVVSTSYYGANDDTAWVVDNKSSESIAYMINCIIKNSEIAYSKTLKAMETTEQLNWNIVAAKMISCFSLSSR